MAIYTTFFLAKPEEILGGFPGWKPPLPAPVRREFRNFLTKQMVTIETCEPEWGANEESSAVPQPRAVAAQGKYEDYLEGRLPPFVREKPHWAAKGMTDVEMEALRTAAGVSAGLKSPAYAPPSSGASLREFPPEFIAKLRAADRLEVAKRWAAEMFTPEHTHSTTGRKLYNGWKLEEASQILTPIVSLANKATPTQAIYLLIEP